MKVQWRHVLIYCLAGLCFWLGLFTYNREMIREFHLGILRKGLEHHARMAEVLYDLGPKTRNLREIRAKIPYNITLISADGKAFADSLLTDDLLEKLPSQLERKEIAGAREKGIGNDLRYNTVTDGWFLYVAVPLSSGGGFIRLRRPVSSPEPTEADIE